MPSVDENYVLWADPRQWVEGGEQWSRRWGGSEAQWHGTLLPRIRRFLPTGTILEIAPGYGRWSHRLRRHCDRLVLVDLSEDCIDVCRQRFAGDDGVDCFVNDGSSLEMIEDSSVDFVFSFDSLVHVEADIVERYLFEFARVLRSDGAGFVHHSNAGDYRKYLELPQALPGRILASLYKARVLDKPHWRALSMTAARFREYCEASGLQCVTQEMVNWNSRRLIDCFSTFAPVGSRWAAPTRVVRNPGFMDEARAVKRWAPLYSSERSDQAFRLADT